MIWIQVRRAGLFVIASTGNDHGEITATIGLTRYSAEQRLHRIIQRSFPKEPTHD